MHRAIILLSMLLIRQSFAAKPPIEKPGILLTTKLAYQSDSKKIETSKELIIPQSNSGWTALVTPKEGVVLLGRMVRNQASVIHMEYLLIDTMSEPTVVSTPAIIARFGDESKISVSGPGGSNEKIDISLHARKTKFRSDSESD